MSQNDNDRVEEVVDVRDLSPEQWGHFKACVVRRAREARAQVLGDLVAWVATNVAAAVKRSAAAYAARRVRRDAFRQLNELDDRMLRDIGVGRSEIGYLVSNQDPTRLPRGKVAAPAIRAPCVRTDIVVRPANKRVIRKNAA